MGRFLCLLALCALMTGVFWSREMCTAHPVFFSLLFPQLVLEFDQETMPENGRWWEAVFL